MVIVHKISNRLAFYSREARFVLKNSLDWQTRFKLLKYTGLFHASNMLGGLGGVGAPFSARLRVGNRYDAEIVIRPFAGDLFILFEVLVDQCYHIPDGVLPPEEVRVILDCGANVGITALYFASRYPNARIFSIEPNDENFELLKHNTAVEPRIISMRGAVVGQPRKTVRLSSERPAWGNFIKDEGEGLEVPAFTVQQIMCSYDLSRIDLLKVDIEGEEQHIFDNGQFLRWVDIAIVELHGDYGFAGFCRDVAKWGFQAVAPVDGGDLKMVIARALNTASSNTLDGATIANRTRL
jgi:FkbM family methyltransferase